MKLPKTTLKFTAVTMFYSQIRLIQVFELGILSQTVVEAQLRSNTLQPYPPHLFDKMRHNWSWNWRTKGCFDRNKKKISIFSKPSNGQILNFLKTLLIQYTQAASKFDTLKN